MRFNFLMPTRVIAGVGVLQTLPALLAELGGRRPMLFTDPVIGRTPFVQRALADLAAARLPVLVSDTCGIDARLTQIDAEAQRAIEAGIDSVVAIGGGSVMCLAKGAALAATNGGALLALRGRTRFERDPLPMIMVPTTAGSGSEVSQWTVLKNDIEHRKMSVGGPQNFPRIALLDPVTLQTLPQRVAALAAVDALTHAVEAYFTDAASPPTDALALEAARRLAASLRGSILERDPAAQFENLVASTMANMACTNAGLGLCHSLASPLEAAFELPHAVAVAGLLPHVFAFNAPAAPERARAMAQALGVREAGSALDAVAAAAALLERLYDDLGVPLRIPAEQVDRAALPVMAERAVTAIARGRTVQGPITPQTLILSQNLRPATVADGLRLYEASIG
ncbi:MAG: iron-containing alcohol dehydrogenase [Burkholderiales bacterium]|nr:iron-containing alcohol dehydrogenase [Burkholderiales bacterium]